MKNFNIIIVIFVLAFNLLSCSKDETVDNGISTVLKGNVSDNIRGINISDYKIVLVKKIYVVNGWNSGTAYETISTAYTDVNGDYTITFNYKLKDDESYAFAKQYYGNPYYPEYLLNGDGIKAGQINVNNINAWKPITLNLNVQVLNNNNPSLNVRNEIDTSTNSFLNTEFIYEQNITKTYYLRSKPDTDIKIIFWYYTGNGISVPTLHAKTFLYHTTLDDINTLNYTIDCSTF